MSQRHRQSVLLMAACLAALLLPTRSQAGGWFMLLGTHEVAFDHPPVLQSEGVSYVSLSVLEELGLNRNAGDAKLESALGGDATAEMESDPADEAPSLKAPPHESYQLGGRNLDVSLPGSSLSVQLDGQPVAGRDLLDAGYGRYVSAATFEKLGLKLDYDPERELPQLVGRIYKVNYGGSPETLTLMCLTPISLRRYIDPDDAMQEGRVHDDEFTKGQDKPKRQPPAGSGEETTLIVEGGYFEDTASRSFDSGPLSRLGFKNLPGSGRAYMYLRQPKRTGFKLGADSLVGFARVSFGNWFQLASFRQTSSGEISVNIELGAPATHKAQIASKPDRLILDFDDVLFDDASQTIKVGVGHVDSIRVGAPEPGKVRVVLDLSAPLDYRVLSKDNGARLWVQLLPPARQPGLKPAQQRRGRAIMLDAGHGGSDQGAPGVVKGTQEAINTLAISKLVQKQLEAMGYTVLQTRTQDRFVSLGQRGDYANYALPYVFVSIHCNSITDPAYTGLMTFHHPYSSAEATALAQSVQDAVLAETGAVDKGVREADFFVLRETIMPAILIETGFMTNREECAALASEDYRRKLATGIAKGIDAYVSASLH